MDLMRFQKIAREKLILSASSDHFKVNYGLRSPTVGPGAGQHGVREAGVVRAYLDDLESTYTYMEAAGRSAPRETAAEGLPVYLLNIAGLMPGTGAFAYPFEPTRLIALPSRSSEPSLASARSFKASLAVHELTHFYNWVCQPEAGKRPIGTPIPHPWAWLDEASAVTIGSLARSRSDDHLRVMPDWIDSPEMPLNSPHGAYRAAMFLRYLEERTSSGLIHSIWMSGMTDPDPLTTIERCVASHGLKLFEWSSDAVDLFTDYCIDSYCAWAGTPGNFAAGAHARFGDRAVTEAFQLRANGCATTISALDHLACRYFKVSLTETACAVAAEVEIDRASGSHALKVVMIEVGAGKTRGRSVPLTTVSEAPSQRPCALRGELANLRPESIEHVVIVVANSGVQAVTSCGDDGVPFTLKVTVT